MTNHLLLPYQQRWVADPSPVQVAEKSRRIGITWASALRAVLESGSVTGQDTFYLGYNHELASEFIRDCGNFARALHSAVAAQGKFLFRDIGPDGEPRDILGYQIRFASGRKIAALTSRPRNLRGKQGRIILDEFAFHEDGDELLKAAMATLMWGGAVSIISTHDGTSNAFYELVEKIKSGKLQYSLHTTTLDDALAEGLFERISMIRAAKGMPITVTKEQWRQDLIDHYGEGADEELFCVPRKSGGVYIGHDLVTAAMSLRDGAVMRVPYDDGFALKDEATRRATVDQWLRTELQPRIDRFDVKRQSWVGQDFGRKADLSVLAVGQTQQDLTLAVPLVLEFRNMPYDQQAQVLGYLVEHLPRFGKAALDATGNGLAHAESAQQKWGESAVLAEKLTEKWYAENLPYLKRRFQDQTITLPPDDDIRLDVMQLQVINGVPKLPKVRVASKAGDKGSTGYRHGDAAIALAMIEFAERQGGQSIAYREVERRGTFGFKGMW